MKILVTGATGFVGQAVVEEAVSRGHEVRAIARSGDVAGAETLRGDLRTMDLTPAFDGIEAVIHTAASLAGDEAEMTRDTVEATEALARAAKAAGARVVLAGSMSVYGADCPELSVIDESTPLETRPDQRDAYTRAKMAQERVLADQLDVAWILRIGAVFGPGRLWNGHIGQALGPVVIRIGGAGEIPLCYRNHAATALVTAAERVPDGIEVVNVLDDDRPDRKRFLRALRRGGWPRLVVPLPWRVLTALPLGRLPGAPGLLRGPVLRARMMPLAYSNARAKDRLDWQPDVGFEAAMEASL